MNDRAKELLEKGLEKARNKKITKKKQEKIMHMHHWQKDAANAWILRDYKTFFLYIVRDAQNNFHCSFSGAKMSAHSSYPDVYASLKEAKFHLTAFINEYEMQLNGVVSE